MPTRRAVNPDAMAMLGRLLDEHCRTYGIRSPEARESVAMSLMRHYQEATTDEAELRAIIAREDDPDAGAPAAKARK